jgi:hypothetical protein
MRKTIFITISIIFGINFFSCRKDKITGSPDAKVHFSQDSVLFDTVFTSIGSSTRNIRVLNTNNQRIKISSIQLTNGTSSQFILNVDGSPGTSFRDIEIAAHDSMYIFIQVNVNPQNSNSPLIISDELLFNVNGNQQKVILEAWGQDAYYHRPTDAIKFKDGSYLPYSRIDKADHANIVWTRDKPHVIYGYLVVDSTQKLTIQAGVRVYMNYKSGLWVYKYGQLQVLGQKGNEVIFQGARREKEYADEPGQWDRIWINEGSQNNVIDYAIIKNGFIGIQAELFGDSLGKSQLTLTNSKIQNMSKWGLYCLFYRVWAGNNVISNCQENLVNVTLGGAYSFIHNTFANYWSRSGRDKAAININNHTETQVLPLNIYFGNNIIDGKLENELNLDIQLDKIYPPAYVFSNSWLKTNMNTTDVNHFINNRKGDKEALLKYKEIANYNFEPDKTETRIKNFVHSNATTDAKNFPNDINGTARNTISVTAGAYEIP